MRVLAIDPGYERMGVAILERNTSGKEILIHSDCIETQKSASGPERLVVLGDATKKLVSEHSPDVLAIETLFLNKNHKTAMLVAAARGVVLYIVCSKKMTVHEYSPLQIKMAITGYGKSDKKQVISMLHRLIPIEKRVKHDDEYDAIAIGLTCLAVYPKKT